MAISNFRVADHDAAWWLYRDASGWKRVSSNGNTFVSALQTVLRDSEALSVPVRTYDGSMVSGSQISVDGAWGPTTYKALWAFLSSRGTERVALDAISASARARIVPNAIVRIAAGVAGLLQGLLPIETPSVPMDAVLPAYGDAGAGQNLSMFTVRDATPAEAGPVGGNVPQVDINVDPFPETPLPPPVTPPYTPPYVPPTGIVPTGQAPQTISRSGLPWGPIVVAGIVIAGIALVAYSVKTAPPQRRRATWARA